MRVLKDVPEFVKFLSQLTNFLALLLLLASSALAIVAKRRDLDECNVCIAIVLLGVVFLSGMFISTDELQSERITESSHRMLPSMMMVTLGVGVVRVGPARCRERQGWISIVVPSRTIAQISSISRLVTAMQPCVQSSRG